MSSVATMSEDDFEATPVYIVPILGSLLIGILCASVILYSEVRLDPVTVLPEAGYGPLLNAVVFVFAAGFGATMIYLLLKRGVHRFLRVLMAVAFSTLTFLLVVFYSELVLVIIDVDVPVAALLVLSLATTAVVILEVFLNPGKGAPIVVILFGGATGSLLGASIPLLSAVLVLLLLAVYDVFAVFYGPVGKIAARGLEHLPGTSFAFRSVHVGLGDLTFYSMLVSRVLLSFGWTVSAAASLGVLLGSFLSFKMVEKKGMFPGLPLSILFGLLASVLAVLIFH
jgi:hypothetical protein